jgi:nicotinamide riboside kinase
MKYWLIIFITSPQGEYIDKDVYSTPNKAACEQVAKKMVSRLRSISKNEIEYVCVSDDHYMGRKQDPGVAYD